MKVCHIFTFTIDIKNPFCELENIDQRIFLPKSHETPHLSGGLDSLLGAGSQKQHLTTTSDCHETLEGRFSGECPQIIKGNFDI